MKVHETIESGNGALIVESKRGEFETSHTRTGV